MSFKSKELMTDILPPGRPFADADLRLCNDSTRVGEDDKCTDSTRPPKQHSMIAQRELNLARLRGDLRQALAERP